MIQCKPFNFVFLLGLLLIFFLSNPSGVLAQENDTQIKGVVKDASTQSAIAGVLVSNQKTKQQTSTDASGAFSIKANVGDVLRFSFLGYEHVNVPVTAIKSIEVAMTASNSMIDEVVVTALGIKREVKSLTYATQQLSGSAVNDVRDNSGNVMSSLTGKVAGAVVTTAATGPGASARVVLRGNKSISGNNNALIVIDGVVFDNSSQQQATGTTYNYGTSDGAANINPDDIESINILKGPSAAALYGSRGANGAIVITTKRGTAGRYQIDYNGSASFDQVNMLTKFQNAYGRGNGGVYADNAAESWGTKAQTYQSNVRDFFENSATFNNTVSTYGGTEKVQGYVSYSNSKIGGIVPGNKLGKNALNLRVNTELIPGLKTDVKLNYLNQKIDNRPRLGDAGTPIEAYIMPRDMTSDELGQYETINPANGQPIRKYWTNSSIYDNPYWSTNRTSVDEQRDRITALGSVTYEFTDRIRLMGRASFDKYIDKTYGKFYDGTVSLGDVRKGGKYYETNARYWERNLDVLLTGDQDLSEQIKLNFTAGASALTRKYSITQDMANGLSIPNHFSLTAATTPEFPIVQDYERRLNSVYGSLQFGFFDYLFLDMTARNDWSSTLKSPHSYFYPSVGVSAVFHEALKLPEWVTFGKVRGSYTIVGNDAEPSLLRQLYLFSQGAGQGFISRSPNKSIEDLKPEKTKSLEVGLDMKFFDNRLGFDFTYYKANTINQLLFIGMPMASGFSRQYINAGDIRNSGMELQLNATPVRKENFSWQTGINFSANTNKVIELSEKTKQVNVTDNTKYATVVVKEGERYGDLYGHKWKVDAATGKYVVGANGLPIVEANKKLGNFNPDALVGWSNSFSYKNFQLNTLIDARIGGEIVSGTAAYLAAFGVGDFTETAREGGLVLDAVTETGAANTTAITAQQLWTTVSQNGRDAWGEFFTYDMTNVRLREVALSYKFKLKEQHFIKNAQVSVTGRNLFFFYRGKSTLNIPGIGKRNNPIDPEAALGAGNYQGVELGLPPSVRTFGMNVKLTF
ncbi:SusC/RagA family TonB-linked outer membrane protein [Sphingobacterium spiritivorum]|uniref:TonB-linked outer membrane protein, SusC/RagA family n=1 Tax=Sphingobacterium spiritivorum ATCC 33861 TaxID=525373 RepID=D7VHC2_SPHSI|nr:SusC/RagA family TonB-linked outer membrane protein [Sphingobacterium spiritivorum]EFK59474.1 TonB-linked outer membrane protein, SusC/RagA family [Sphingobacterium spiritivorum ATCC 33861]QQT33847.1 SusC/RagA family TonB-linked outer membrane protein [Sphingobacterium spiritivorum]WQD34665.1 SusC/RagA family TonB-linked outer membrane protein [Sphingobacterium spiritivorum]SUI97662.1 TonB-linked outer membrane protein, SusC/RagA family [Sphingobacterium spiritivorum]